MKKILAIILAALLLFSMIACGKDDTVVGEAEGKLEEEVVAEVLEYGYFEYSVNEEGNYEIVGFTYSEESNTTAEIPSEIDGRPVTGIGADAFKAVTALTDVKIPDSVKYIAQYAFYGCTGLTEITLPDSITEIGTGAFDHCSSLKKITLSSKLVSIDSFAFMECASLESITFPETLVSIGNGAFWGCDKLAEIVIPASVKSIGDGAFIYCDALTKITVNSESLVIGDTAFVDYTDNLEIIIKADATVFYNGNAKGWTGIVGEISNEYKVYYFSEEAPKTSDVYWHFVDETPVVWVLASEEA